MKIEFNAAPAFKDYSTVMFALVITPRHFSRSSATNLVVSATLPPTGSTAIFANCSLASGNIALFSTKIQSALRAADLRKLALLCLL
jgi:hypothetical protein